MEQEEDLVARAREGDREAFSQLVERNQSRIYNLTLRLTGNPDDALELTQEAFLNAWRGVKSFQGGSSFSTWLYRLASNAAIDFLRREKRRRGVSMTISLDGEEEERQAEVPDERGSPQEELERRETRELVRWGLSQLSEEHRQVLTMRELSGLSYAEIAQVLDLEEGTVKSRIARARISLRKILVESGNFSLPTASIESK